MLAARVRRRREALGLSIRALALKARVPYATVHGIEQGKTTNPGVVTLRQIAEVLGCTLNDLAGHQPAQGDVDAR